MTKYLNKIAIWLQIKTRKEFLTFLKVGQTKIM